MLQTNEELSKSKLIGVTPMHIKDEPVEITYYLRNMTISGGKKGRKI